MKVKGHEGQLSKWSLVLKGRKSTRSLVQQVSCPKVRCTEVTWQKVNTEKVSCLSTKLVGWWAWPRAIEAQELSNPLCLKVLG